MDHLKPSSRSTKPFDINNFTLWGSPWPWESWQLAVCTQRTTPRHIAGGAEFHSQLSCVLLQSTLMRKLDRPSYTQQPPWWVVWAAAWTYNEQPRHQSLTGDVNSISVKVHCCGCYLTTQLSIVANQTYTHKPEGHCTKKEKQKKFSWKFKEHNKEL